MRVRLDSIGCRLNIGEMEHLARQFAAAGHRVVGPGDAADLFVFNSCAVTHVAARKSRKALRQIRRQYPCATVVATGCYAELSPRQVSDLGVDMVVANADKDRLPEILQDAGLITDADPVGAPDSTPFAAPVGGRTRAFVKVQDGCDNRCTFCIVTVARGDSRSRDADAVVAEIQQLCAAGYREVVLSGVHLGSYGQDLAPGVGLGELLQRILEDTEIERLRLSSLEPWDLSAGLFDLWSNPRLLPHLHLPLQSGCDATLQRMARRTDQASFSRLVAWARNAIPDLAISTDVIVGFPGECDAEFQESLDFVREMQFARLHVFRYSGRQGTAAWSMPDPVQTPVAQERSRRMHALGAELESRFQRRHLGFETEVLWEANEPFAEGLRWNGLTGNYLRVITDTTPTTDLHNRVLRTELNVQLPGALYGTTPHSIVAGLSPSLGATDGALHGVI